MKSIMSSLVSSLIVAGALALALTPTRAPAQADAAVSTAAPQAPEDAPAPRGHKPCRLGAGFERTVQIDKSGPWTGRRLSDGQPDIEGNWSNTVANHDNFTDPQGGIPGDSASHCDHGPRDARAPSRVSDPADGQIPYQPWARALQQEFSAHFFSATKPEYVEPYARCAPAGIPKSLYHVGYEIRQYPGYVVFLFDSGWRIIHLDNKPHLPANIKLWNGDSRGHWEGNTLVVDVSNENSKSRFGRDGNFASENVHIVERYIFSSDNRHYTYVATFTDPMVYTRPFTVTIPARRWTLADKFNEWHVRFYPANVPAGKKPVDDQRERICVEDNGGFGLGADPNEGPPHDGNAGQ